MNSSTVSSTVSSSINLNLTSIENQCKYHADKTKNLTDNFTITYSALFNDKNELNNLELFLREIFEKLIEDNKTEIYIYCVMFIIGFIGNIFVLISLYKNDRKSRRRENTLFIHLSLVDLLIVMVIVPVEVYWKSTYSWELGLFACKLFQFFKNYFM